MIAMFQGMEEADVSIILHPAETKEKYILYPQMCEERKFVAIPVDHCISQNDFEKYDLEKRTFSYKFVQEFATKNAGKILDVDVLKPYTYFLVSTTEKTADGKYMYVAIPSIVPIDSIRKIVPNAM